MCIYSYPFVVINYSYGHTHTHTHTHRERERERVRDYMVTLPVYYLKGSLTFIIIEMVIWLLLTVLNVSNKTNYTCIC